MESFFPQLLNTILLRPYVFIFLLVYLLGCSMHLGIKKTLLFMAAGYLITWLSEFSSIHTGIPYGLYYYIENTKGHELWVFGVPFMDSLSYVFLAYASYSMALLTVSPALYSRGIIYLLETRAIRSSLITLVVGAIFFVYLDIIIDPVALQGSRWFLGQIYGYPEKGAYFGVPVSNFIGWFAVGLILIFVLQKIDNYMSGKGTGDMAGYRHPWRYLIGPALYLGVLIFNLSVTFYIGEYTMGWVGVFIVLFPLSLVCTILKMKLSRADQQKEIEEHLKDFPEAAGLINFGMTNGRGDKLRIAIFATLPQELGPVRKNLKAVKAAGRHPFDIYQASRSSIEIVLLATGMGTSNAESAFGYIQKEFSPDLVLSIGYGGALYEGAEIGDIVWGSKFVSITDFPAEILTLEEKSEDRKIFSRLSDAVPVLEGAIITVRGLTRKSELIKEIPAGLPNPVCDMETFAVARLCRQAGLRFIAIRSITDLKDEDIPPEFIGIPDESGEYDLYRALRVFVSDPLLILAALRLGMNSMKASRSLSRAVDSLLAIMQ